MLNKNVNPNNKLKLQHDTTLQIATAASRTAKTWQNKQMALSNFIAHISQPTVTPETVEEYHALPKSQQDEIKDKGGFFGGALNRGKRTKEHVISRSIVTLDADYADCETLGRIQAALGGMAYSYYTTHKHTPEKPRYRLLVYPDRAIRPNEYGAVIRKLAEMVGIDQFDDTTYDINRLMYWPSKSCDGAFECGHNDQPMFSVNDILASYGDADTWRQVWTWPKSSRETKVFDGKVKRQGDPLEKGGIVGAWCKTYSIYEAIKMVGCYEPAAQFDNRFTYTPGSTSGGLVVYQDRFTYSHHSTDPTHGLLCNSFDLYRLHKYGELDEKVDPDKPTHELPSYAAMRDYAKRIKGVKENLIKSRLDDFDDVSDEDVDQIDFAHKLHITESGAFKLSFYNACIFVENDKKINNIMRYNNFSYRVENAETGQLWSTNDSSEIRRYLGERYEADFPESKVEKAIELRADVNSYHPVQDYLNSLTWDGTPRIDTLLIRYFDCTDIPYNREVISKWMIAAVARIIDPGIKWDYVPVLGGTQGIGKTTFIRTLGCEKWYGELNSFDPKIAMEDITGKWIVEITEMGATNRHDLEQQKAFLSGQSTTTRVAYARHPKEYKRQCVFIGTTNQSEYLKDSTGNRRWWPVDCKITDVIDIKGLTAELDQLWAEAFTRYSKDGLQLLSNAAKGFAESAQQNKLCADEWAGMIGEWLVSEALSDRYKENPDFNDVMAERELRDKVCIPEVWNDCLGQSKIPMKTQDRNRISTILDKMPDWKRTPKPLRFGKRFGVQRGWTLERVNPESTDDKEFDVPF